MTDLSPPDRIVQVLALAVNRRRLRQLQENKTPSIAAELGGTDAKDGANAVHANAEEPRAEYRASYTTAQRPQ